MARYSMLARVWLVCTPIRHAGLGIGMDEDSPLIPCPVIGQLTICMLGNFSCFCFRLLTFFQKLISGTLLKCQTVWIQIRTNIHKINVSCFVVVCWLKYSLMDTIRVSNSLDPDQDRQNVGPDLDPNCLQRSPVDDSIYLGMESTALSLFTTRCKICQFSHIFDSLTIQHWKQNIGIT